MSSSEPRLTSNVHQYLRDVQNLLIKQQTLTNFGAQNPAGEIAQQQHSQALQELALRNKLDAMHLADIAYILEALPHSERNYVWDLVKAERGGEILLEVSDPVRDSLLEAMDPDEIKAAAGTLDTNDLADLAPDLPPGIVHDVVQSLDQEERDRLRAAMSYPEGSVGALMDFDMVAVREDVSLEVILRYLRRLGQFPEHTDKLFVVDRDGLLRGTLSLEEILTNDPDKTVTEVMSSNNIVSFKAKRDADEAAAAFERYDLISAPVVDDNEQVIGRLTVADVVDHIREESEQEILNNAGLREEEDVFASVWDSVRNRLGWLAINMVTAIIASRVIGLFEDSIHKIVALATLMPIVAGIGGNSGNQTTTMIVRAIAVGKVEQNAIARLMRKEATVALINGLLWGGLLGLLAWALYDSISLGLVMSSAMLLNLLLASCAGVLIPLLRSRFGKDPALGSSVMITALTDSGGFFIFLGLATLFLV